MEEWIQAHKDKKYLLAAAGAILLIFAIIAGCAIGSGGGSKIEITDSNRVYVRVEPGMSGSEIAAMLIEKGVIDSKLKFTIASKMQGADDKFKTGLFELARGMAPGDAVAVLISGKVASAHFTIPEGYNVQQIAKRLADEGLADEKKFLEKARDYAPYPYIEENHDANFRAEGFLFPDTYEIATDATEDDILELLTSDFDSRLTPEMRSRAQELGLSIYELVTMASLVEKESFHAEDMPIIAQVFFKRLKISMPLQSDTTITYLIGAKDDVSIDDTKVDSPYNTYQNYGLPPGPIANPGMQAIEAVLHPADTDYLYFVADHDGNNFYSNTYEEHLAIVDQVR